MIETGSKNKIHFINVANFVGADFFKQINIGKKSIN